MQVSLWACEREEDCLSPPSIASKEDQNEVNGTVKGKGKKDVKIKRDGFVQSLNFGLQVAGFCWRRMIGAK